jgi:hypothetical protein
MPDLAHMQHPALLADPPEEETAFGHAKSGRNSQTSPYFPERFTGEDLTQGIQHAQEDC